MRLPEILFRNFISKFCFDFCTLKQPKRNFEKFISRSKPHVKSELGTFDKLSFC